MNASPWSLDAAQARLELGPLSATLNLRDPASGLQQLRLDATAIQANLFGVLLKTHTETSPSESYVRCEDLVATYPPSPGRAMRVQIYWRCHALPERLAVELQVSVQTDELGIGTPVVVSSRVPAIEALRLIDPGTASCASLALEASTQRLVPQDGPGCLLLRLPASDWCYAEMIHSADFQQDSISFQTANSGARIAILEHHLFPETLEKGVILRARLRGLFLRASQPATEVARDYRSFLASPLPLTT